VASVASCGQVGHEDAQARNAATGQAGAAAAGAAAERLEDEMEDEQEYVMAIAVSPDESTAAAAWSDYGIRLYDLQHGLSGASTQTLLGHSNRVSAVTFGNSATDPKSVFSCDEDGAVVAWDRTTLKPAQNFVLGNRKIPASALAVGCDNNLIAVGTDDSEESNVVFFDRRSSRKLGEYTQSHTDTITQLVFNPHKPTHLTSSSTDGLMCYFDVAKQDEEEATISVMNVTNPVRKVGYFGPFSECLYALTFNESISLFHADKAVSMAEFHFVRDLLTGAGAPSDYLVDCFYAQGKQPGTKSQALVLVSGDHKGRMYLSDLTLAGVQRLCVLEGEMGHTRDVRAVAALARSPVTGIPSRLLSGGEDGLVCDWRHRDKLEATTAHGRATRRTHRTHMSNPM